MEGPPNQVKPRRGPARAVAAAAAGALLLGACSRSVSPAALPTAMRSTDRAAVVPVATAADPRVLLISIDGLRPDVALRADMPNLRELMSDGAFTFWATTTPAAITLPSHTSMLTGVTIERHGIEGNDDDAAMKKPLLVPTIFDLAHAAGLSTAMVSGKSKFVIYAKPIDHVWCPTATKGFKRVRFGSTKPSLHQETIDDDVVGDLAVDMLAADRPRLMFVHFAMNDVIGHARGWGSAAQLANLATTDAALGQIVAELKALGLYDATTIILTADHGGSGRQHGKDDEPSKFIPWVIEGPGVRHGVDLTLFHKREIRTYDTFATACRVLGLPVPADSDGHSVTQAFESTELLKGPNDPPPDPPPATQPGTKKP